MQPRAPVEAGSAAPPDDLSTSEIADVALGLGTDLERGLGAAEAAARLRADGPNELRAVPSVPLWRRALAQLQEPLVYLLGAAAAVALAAWWFEGRGHEGAAGWPLDAIVILAVVVVNAVLGFMILADDNFATIVLAVREGRGVLGNIRKFLRFLLSSNLAEVLTVLVGVVGAGVIGLEATATGSGGAVVLPLLATQLLWINLITDTGPALAMGVDPIAEDVMVRKPRARSQRIIDARMGLGVLEGGVVMAVMTLLTLDLFLPGGMIEPVDNWLGPGPYSLDLARTAAFTVLVLTQLLNCFNARSESASAFRAVFANRWLWAAVGLSTAMQVAVVHLPFLNLAFGTVPLSVGQWFVCVAMASGVLWLSEGRKLLLRIWAGRRRR